MVQLPIWILMWILCSCSAVVAQGKEGVQFGQPRRALLPNARVIKDERDELWSHVVRIRSQSNGVGTGVLLKKNFVLTAKRVVQGFLDPFEFTLELGNETSQGLAVFLHPSSGVDLAVIKVHPPFLRTGRMPALASPKGFFWPLAAHDPSPAASISLFGYGGSSSFSSPDYLTTKSFPLSPSASSRLLLFRSKSALPTTSGDAGGPAFLSHKHRTSLVGIITASKPHQGALISIAKHRDWVFNSMKSTCSREEQTFIRLLVGTDPDILIYYHCKVERAERLGIHLTSKPAPCYNPGWKSIRITSARTGKVLGKVHTQGKRDKDSVVLTPKKFKSTPHFYLELWKPKPLHGSHTMVAKYGPFNVSDYIDGGLHFEWCQS
ncbi:hypothetical protein GOP47_0028696 [Adiantum capillus-veneris]|nr:hypothetical protein GOP47_0028696 [Adiantum capillus-veneris]